MGGRPVGVFDSGVGGLGVLAALTELLPDESFLYFADQRHAPYGERTLEDVRDKAFRAVDFLLAAGVKLVAVACNTASAAALRPLRGRHPGFPFVGMEPAVKPAAEDTRSGRIGVIATAATFQGELYAGVVDRFARGRGVAVMAAACPELVVAVENGEPDSPELEAVVRERLRPMREAGMDRLVLGCTHFPFARELIARAAGPGVLLYDPAPAVAERVRQVLTEMGALAPPRSPGGGAPPLSYVTTGEPRNFDAVAARLLGRPVRSGGTAAP